MSKDNKKEHPDVKLCRELRAADVEGSVEHQAANRIEELRAIIHQMEQKTRIAARDVQRAGKPPTNF